MRTPHPIKIDHRTWNMCIKSDPRFIRKTYKRLRKLGMEDWEVKSLIREWFEIARYMEEIK